MVRIHYGQLETQTEDLAREGASAPWMNRKSIFYISAKVSTIELFSFFICNAAKRFVIAINCNGNLVATLKEELNGRNPRPESTQLTERLCVYNLKIVNCMKPLCFICRTTSQLPVFCLIYFCTAVLHGRI